MRHGVRGDSRVRKWLLRPGYLVAGCFATRTLGMLTCLGLRRVSVFPTGSRVGRNRRLERLAKTYSSIISGRGRFILYPGYLRSFGSLLWNVIRTTSIGTAGLS